MESADAVTVPATTLDALLTEVAAGVRVAAWVDVEGANREVLTGGATLLGRVDLIKIEVETQEMWSGQWLAVDVLDGLAYECTCPVGLERRLCKHTVAIALAHLDRQRSDAAQGIDVLRQALEAIRGEALIDGLLGLARRDPRVRAAARSVSALARRVR